MTPNDKLTQINKQLHRKAPVKKVGIVLLRSRLTKVSKEAVATTAMKMRSRALIAEIKELSGRLAAMQSGLEQNNFLTCFVSHTSTVPRAYRARLFPRYVRSKTVPSGRNTRVVIAEETGFRAL